MDASFWWGIGGGVAVTVLVGLPLSFVANIYTPVVSQTVARWRSSRQEKSKVKAHRAYILVKKLSLDPLAQLLYFQNQYGLISYGCFTGVISLLIAVALFHIYTIATIVPSEDITHFVLLAGLPPKLPLLIAGIPLIMCFLTMSIVGFQLSRITTLRWRISHFDEFERQTLSKWGSPDDIEASS